MTRITSTTIAAAVLLAALAGSPALAQATTAPADAGPAPAPAEPPPALVGPLEHDFGWVDIGETVEGSFWVVNPGTTPVRIERLAASCPCIRPVDFRPVLLEPGRGARFRIALDAPREVDGRTRKILRLEHDKGEPWRMPVFYQPVNPSTFERVRYDAGPEPLLQPVRPVIEYGHADAGKTLTEDVWLVNASREPIKVRWVKVGCSCMTLLDWDSSVVIEPGRAWRTRMEMTAGPHVGQTRLKSVTFIPDRGEPVTLGAKITTIDPENPPLPPGVTAGG